MERTLMARRGWPAPHGELAQIASVLAVPTRAAMLDVLLDGQPRSIGALARDVRITAATASTHLARLVEARLVAVETVGRTRRVRLAGPDVAEVLERLTALATNGPAPGREGLRFARTCYDHIAGVLAIVVADALVARGWLHRTSDNFEPAPALFAWLAERGHAVELRGRRPLSRACLDWTERVPHVAGRIGSALLAVMVGARWVVPVRSSRGLRVTDGGRAALAEEL
ncbi:MAG TPA: helix-turn-helix transcriptional regulator, partial [Kofleriaceae bacterium]|nr:helix-turn-helix transcriptional regulator [Kofleriaceae bacterium]